MPTPPVVSSLASPRALGSSPTPALTTGYAGVVTAPHEGRASASASPAPDAAAVASPRRTAPWSGASFAEVVRRVANTGRQPSPPERAPAKRIRIVGGGSAPASSAQAAPSAAVATVPPPPPPLSSRERYALLIEGGRAAQPAASACSWEASVDALCMQSTQTFDGASLTLLEKLLELPANVQAQVAQCTADLCPRPFSSGGRFGVLEAVRQIVEEDGAAGLRELRRALAHVRGLKAKRGLLFALRSHVPAGARRHFLRLAESLLQSGDAEDLKVVREAAEACFYPLRPRGRTDAERGRQEASTSTAVPAAAPDMTAEDIELMEMLMNEECDRVEQDDADADLDTERNPNTAAAAPSSSTADALTELVHRAESENVQDDEAIALTKEAWQYLAVRYRRDLPEEAIFLLVHGAYKAQVREARHGVGRLLANAFPNQEKDWPTSFTIERQRIWVELDKERAEESGKPELPTLRLLRLMFAGNADGRMNSVLANDDMSYHLDEEDLTTQQFVSIVWSAMHRRGEEAEAGSEAEVRAERERDNLRHSFWRGLADNVLVHVRVDKPLSLERLCHNGLAQRMLERFEGYEPFTIHPTRTGQLLCLLGGKFDRKVVQKSPSGEPSAQQVREFVQDARKAAAQTFSKRRLPFFERELAIYLRRDYEEFAEQALAEA